MKTENVVVDKSYQFSLRIVKLYMHLKKNKIERELILQLLRSGTSIGANIEESIGGSSKRDFIHKLEIAYREARETKYWLRLLRDSDLLETKLADSFIKDGEEILKILTAILKSSKAKKIINC
ncbi:four helix bundle protein [Ferruginibacter albus]|uniref:four helix bundle protein n=1 Tax=Ferruginibacter albus TaxID=2875540 RepID=UPI001CC5CCCD|nr:four helix bundle protein [Ferruginibacter albus]UAY50964.1 four helix bundle protein [Ferruginibacter albus]